MGLKEIAARGSGTRGWRLLIATAALAATPSFAAGEPGRQALPTRAPASVQPTVTQPGKPLDVKGQARSWNRMVGGGGDREVIDFVRTRADYRDEIDSNEF